MLSVNQNIWHQELGWSQEAVVLQWRGNPRLCLEEMRNTVKTVRKHSTRHDRNQRATATPDCMTKCKDMWRSNLERQPKKIKMELTRAGWKGTEEGKQCVLLFYIRGYVHRESNLMIFQQDVTVFSLLYFCRQLYIFRLLTTIVRSSYNCNYGFWHWSTGSATIRSRGW